MSNRFAPLAVTVGLASAVVAGCSQDSPTGPEPAAAPVSQSSAKPGDPGSASDRMFFKARLAPLGGSRAVGVVLLEVVGDHLTARVHATGLEPLQHIPQHIHVNPTCANGGGVLINLDENLAVAGEAPPTGAAFPVANRGGVVNYEASRPLSELMAAVNQYFGTSLTTTGELLAWMDLVNRNAHMHVPFGPPFPAVTCGEIDRVN